MHTIIINIIYLSLDYHTTYTRIHTHTYMLNDINILTYIYLIESE